MRYGIWRTSTRKPHRARKLVVTGREELASPVFSPDGRQIAFFDGDGISVIRSSGAGPSRRLLRSKRLLVDTTFIGSRYRADEDSDSEPQTGF